MHKFIVAFKGIFLFFKEELNARIHAVISLLVIGAGLFFNVTKSEWLSLVFAIGLVFTAEILNTAIERTMDLVRPEKDIKVGKVKDIAAAAVLFASIIAAIIGLWIFIPYLMQHH